MERKNVEAIILGHVQILEKFAKRWQAIYLVIGIAAIVSSLVVTTFTAELGIFLTRVVAFISALSVGLIHGLDLPSRGRRYRTAWRHLTEAHMNFMAGKYSDEELVKAYGEAENVVGHFNVSLPSSEQS